MNRTGKCGSDEEDSKKERNCVNQEESSCITYFRQCTIWNRVFKGFKEKYASYGYFGGTVVLRSLTMEEMEELEGFFGKNFHGQKSVSVSAMGFESALQKSKFKAISPQRILELYFEEELCSKKEIKRKEELDRLEIFQKVQKSSEGTFAYSCLESVADILKGIRMKDLEEWERLLYLSTKIINQFPYRNQEYLYLAVFAAKVTGNPHAFDQGTTEGGLLKMLIKDNLHRRGIDEITAENKSIDSGSDIFPVFARQKEYLEVGILLDDISNYTMLFGVHGWNKNGNLHAGLEGFFQEQEIVQLPLAVVVNLSRLECIDNRIYIVENPSVFASLTADKSRKISCMCMNGQPRLSSLMVLKLLEKSGTVVYYAGDLDPEGLLIAQKLKHFYQGDFYYWHMGEEDYKICRSQEKISSKRLQSLAKITDEELMPVAELLRSRQVAGYQELLIYHEDMQNVRELQNRN